MATLWITEFSNLGTTKSGNNTVQAPFVPGVAEQAITISGTSAQSAAFNTNTRFVMLHTDTACYLAWGSNPTATTYQLMAADETRFYSVNPSIKVAVKS